MAKRKAHTYRVVHPDWEVDYTGTVHPPVMVNPVVASVALTAEGAGAGDGTSFVRCAVPGGRPWMEMREGSTPINVSNAPTCDNADELFDFVVERWGRDEIEDVA